MPAREEALAVALVVVIALASVTLATIAAGSASLAGMRDAGPEPTCVEWTDDCVVCRRTPQGPACSTPGIACLRGPMRCLRP